MFFYNVNAYAYLDPGTGSIILQALAGAVAAISSFFYYYGKKVKDFFKKFKKNKKENKEHNKVDSE
jgi:O-antigen/teichoic acid export membrane protein|tara:strand:- start:503 stop:700 length:198 start_codon:yes stop_codon:yes gene_type:complete